MLSRKRQELILEKINKDKSVEVAALTNELEASESTIRRDISELHSKGLLKKVHGGAVALKVQKFDFDQNLEYRQRVNPEGKDAIARYAASLINDNDIIYIDSGTTTFMMIRYIEAENVVAVTNSIRNAQELTKKGIRTIILGGEVKLITEAVVGYRAVETLKEYNFQKAFLGTNGVDINRGCTTPDPNEAVVKECAIKISQQVFVLADSSKLEQISLVSFCSLDNVTIITDDMNDMEFETEVVEVKK